MLLRLAGRMPDGLLTQSRDWLARGQLGDLARSVAFCADQMGWHLGLLAQEHDGPAAAHRALGELSDMLDRGRNGALFQRGLHESVQQCLALTNRLASEIAEAYHF